MALKLLFCLIAISIVGSNSLKLEQVLVLSRHNIRTPLTSKLDNYAPKIWPKFNESVAKLTHKGALLESFIAQYFAEWLANEDLIKGCPEKDEVLIYSNTKSRTRDTAKSFTKGAFGPCNISIHHLEDIKVFDPMFYPIFHNNTDYFKQKMTIEMEQKINEVDLTEAYLELNRILDINNSYACKQNNVCDLSKMKYKIVIKEGEEPNVSGALAIGTSIVDTFLMSFYEGFPLENVAWGEITTQDQWRLLTKITRQNLNVRFNQMSGSKDIADPLIKYMFGILKSGYPKLTVLVGHDSNLASVMNALNFKEFRLDNSYEPYPIGGKLVFQKWSDGDNKFLKVEYVYQTFSQLRNSDKLTLTQPPKRVLLELKDCTIDDNGFCPWDNFIQLDF